MCWDFYFLFSQTVYSLLEVTCIQQKIYQMTLEFFQLLFKFRYYYLVLKNLILLRRIVISWYKRVERISQAHEVWIRFSYDTVPGCVNFSLTVKRRIWTAFTSQISLVDPKYYQVSNLENLITIVSLRGFYIGRYSFFLTFHLPMFFE